MATLPYNFPLTSDEIQILANAISFIKEAKGLITDGYLDGYVDGYMADNLIDISPIVPTLNQWIALLTFNPPPNNKFFHVMWGTAISVIKTNGAFDQPFRMKIVEPLIPVWRKYAGYNTFIEALSY